MKRQTEPQELETKNNNSVATVAGINFEADAGKGLEGADRKSYAIPFLVVLQGLSPQVINDSPAGAKPGMLLNTITDQLMKEAVVIPCAFQRRFVRWGRRENGGGYKGDYSPIDVELGRVEGARLADDGFTWEMEDDILKDTRNHYVLVRAVGDEKNWSPAVLSLQSTQIKKSKRWLS